MPGTKEEKTDFLFYKALWFKDKGQLVKALFCLGKVLRLDPKNEECLQEMGSLGYLMKRSDIGLNALLGLYNHGLIKPRQLPFLCQLLEKDGNPGRDYQKNLEDLSWPGLAGR